MKMFQVLTGDVREKLKTLPDKSVQCCVTSPPYYGLRDYGTAKWEGGDDPDCDHLRVNDTRENVKQVSTNQLGYGTTCGKCGAKRTDAQIGLEETPAEYVESMVQVFREVKRVLRDDGTLWLNLGDSYASDTKGSGGPSAKQLTNPGSRYESRKFNHGLKAKDLIGIPWRVAFALQEDGWWLRNDIIWHKTNSMPESVTDRCTRSHEYIFLLTKSPRYFFDADAIKVPATYAGDDRGSRTDTRRGTECNSVSGVTPAYRNKRTVWSISTQPFKGAHFATFPVKLIEPCILAGTSEHGACAKCGAPWQRIVVKGAADLESQQACGGDEHGEYDGEGIKDYEAAGVQNPSDVKARILAGMVERKTIGWEPTCKCTDATVVPCVVLDPFTGSGTTGAVSVMNNRRFVGTELNPKYAAMARERIDSSYVPHALAGFSRPENPVAAPVKRIAAPEVGLW
jgi:DNA modification methylase